MRFQNAHQVSRTSRKPLTKLSDANFTAGVALESPLQHGDSANFKVTKEPTMNSPQAKEQTPAEKEVEHQTIKPFDPWERYFNEDKESPLYTFGLRSPAPARNRN